MKPRHLINDDATTILRGFPDKHFGLACVDPPYGEGIHTMSFTQSQNGGIARRNDYSSMEPWDKQAPDKEYFDELFRVSKHQIIFGANFFLPFLPATRCMVIWDKRTEDKYNNDFADCEIAWTSFDRPARIYRYLWSGMLQGNMKDKEQRIHPTQKPVALYRRLLADFAQPGMHTLDTHMGSGSCGVAAHYCDLEYTGIELIPRTFKAARKRIDRDTRQYEIQLPEQDRPRGVIEAKNINLFPTQPTEQNPPCQESEQSSPPSSATKKCRRSSGTSASCT